MTTDWRAIPVDYALAVRAADDDERPHDSSPPDPIRITRPGQKLALKVWFRNETPDPRESKVRLVGLREAIVPSSETTVAQRPKWHDAEWHAETFVFQLPQNLLPGEIAAAIEWVAKKESAGPGGDGLAEFEVLAVGELPVIVDDVSKVAIDVAPKVSSGLSGHRIDVTLTNGGVHPVELALESYAPSNDWPENLGPAPEEGRKEHLSVDFSPSTVHLAAGERCVAHGNVRRRVRWFGSTKSHVFDVSAVSASGSVTASSEFRQRAVLPPLLFKAIAIVGLVVVVLWLLLRLVTAIVSDSPGDRAWQQLPAPEIVARSEHTATWMNFTRPERTGIAGVVDRVLGRSNRDNAVAIWGGETAGGNLLADGSVYSDEDGSWKPMEPLDASEARVGHTAAWTGEHLVVWGGFAPQHLTPDADGNTIETRFYGAAFEPVSGRWQQLPPSGLSPRVGHSMIWTGKALIVFGGVSPDGRVLGDGGILRAGPLNTDGSATEKPAGDLTNGVWSLFRAGDLGSFRNAPRAYHAATFDGQYMVVSGGIGPLGPVDQRFPELLNDAFAYDVQRNQWTYIGHALFERRACHQMSVANGMTVVLGGLKPSDIEAADRPPTGGNDAADALALSDAFCGRPRELARRDPAPLLLTLTPPGDEPGGPTFEWTPLAGAPNYLGANFVSASTDHGVGVAIPILALDGTVPLLYQPGQQAAADRLASTDQLGYRSQLFGAWEPTTSRLLLWGGRGPYCGDGTLPAERVPSETTPACLQRDGARINVAD